VSPGTYKQPTMKDHYHRDKLLKKERDTIFKQNMKMKRFINTFDYGEHFVILYVPFLWVLIKQVFKISITCYQRIRVQSTGMLKSAFVDMFHLQTHIRM